MQDYPTILLIDDDIEDRVFLQEIFEGLGYQSSIEFADNGEHALLYLEKSINDQKIPHLIVLDLNMPRMNGTQVLRLLKKNNSLKDITVIIYSTSLNPIERDECIALGAHSYVIKPITYNESIANARMFYDLATA
ncbi:MAG: response regulator [Candidatus Pseudobacter hemicellulosilyticus]|uniref:Response regulator n=1 Tax=Candidatus Pseudobacter hemicellulosilyticus TaxID=3121375 RepID=A0AAJ6BIQ1_9BACT|nr:MAG: response regulator [Pseudobacter sp.]